MHSGIYMIVNIKNGMKYIGATYNLEGRWFDHKAKLRCKSTKCNKYLQRDWDKYGEEAFRFFIIKECPIEDLDKGEKFYIDYFDVIYPKGYNLQSGGKESYRNEQSYKDRVSLSSGRSRSNIEESKLEEIYYRTRNIPFGQKQSVIRKLAVEYNTSFSTVRRIVYNKHWICRKLNKERSII